MQNKTSDFQNAAISLFFDTFLLNFQCLLFINPCHFVPEKVIRQKYREIKTDFSNTKSPFEKNKKEIRDQIWPKNVIQ